MSCYTGPHISTASVCSRTVQTSSKCSTMLDTPTPPSAPPTGPATTSHTPRGATIKALLVVVLLWVSPCRGLFSSDVPEYCQYDTFNATCPADHVVMMTVARYGRMRLGQCVVKDYGYVGCQHDVIPEVDRRCSGRQSCAISVPDENLHRLAPCPKDLSAYFAASYVCLPVIQSTLTSCNRREATLTSLSGNIASIVTERSIYGTDECPWRIEALPGQRINLTLYDFNTVSSSGNQQHQLGDGSQNSLGSMALYSKSNGFCRAYAIVREADESSNAITVCSTPVRVAHAYMSRTNSVVVRLLNKRSNTKDYFLIEYNVVGCPTYVPQPLSWIRYEDDIIVVTCNKTRKSWTVRCEGNQWVGEGMNCSLSGSHVATGWNSHRKPSSMMHLPVELTVVIISSVAFVVVIVVLVFGLLCMRRRKMRKRPPRTNPLLAADNSDKDPYGFTMVGTVGRCPAHRMGGPDASRSPMKEKLYASAIEMKCPRHRSTVTVDGGYTNIWETRYPPTISGGPAAVESEYGIRLVDASDKHDVIDTASTTQQHQMLQHQPQSGASLYGTTQAQQHHHQKPCLISSPSSLHHQHHPHYQHHHLHGDDPRIESTKLVKSHACKKYEDSELPVYYDGANVTTDGYGRNLDTGAHATANATEAGTGTTLNGDESHNNSNNSHLAQVT